MTHDQPTQITEEDLEFQRQYEVWWQCRGWLYDLATGLVLVITLLALLALCPLDNWL